MNDIFIAVQAASSGKAASKAAARAPGGPRTDEFDRMLTRVGARDNGARRQNEGGHPSQRASGVALLAHDEPGAVSKVATSEPGAVRAIAKGEDQVADQNRAVDASGESEAADYVGTSQSPQGSTEGGSEAAASGAASEANYAAPAAQNLPLAETPEATLAVPSESIITATSEPATAAVTAEKVVSPAVQAVASAAQAAGRAAPTVGGAVPMTKADQQAPVASTGVATGAATGTLGSDIPGVALGVQPVSGLTQQAMKSTAPSLTAAESVLAEALPGPTENGKGTARPEFAAQPAANQAAGIGRASSANRALVALLAEQAGSALSEAGQVVGAGKSLASADSQPEPGVPTQVRPALQAQVESVLRQVGSAQPGQGAQPFVTIHAAQTAASSLGQSTTPSGPMSASGTPFYLFDLSDPARIAGEAMRIAGQLRGAALGTSEARLLLHPENLGSVHVRMELHAGTISARMIVESQAAEQALQSSLPYLDQAFRAQGFGDVRILVASGNPGFAWSSEMAGRHGMDSRSFSSKRGSADSSSVGVQAVERGISGAQREVELRTGRVNIVV